MDQLALCQAIKAQYDLMPKQVRQAAGFVLNHPQEVAVMSMREQARLAGVPPSTMTRLAKRLGLPGYDAVRAIFVNQVRARGYEYGSRVPALVEMTQKAGETSLLLDVANTTAGHIQALCRDENLAAMARAAGILSEARHIYCLGLRSSFPVAFHFCHVASYFKNNVHLVDGAGESGIMALMRALGPKDVLLVCSLSPYSSRSVSLARYLSQQKVKVVAISDNASSPVARLAVETILVNKKTTAFFDTLTPALMVSELLVALMAATSKVDVRRLVSQTEEKLWAMGEWWSAQ